MSDLRIKDGFGSGSIARVDDGRLWTQTVVRSSRANAANTTGYSFSFSAQSKTLPGTGSYPILRMKNVDTLRNFYICKLVGSWNGGSTNFNRPLACAIYADMSAPTANYTSITPSSSNLGKSISPSADAQIWNDVGNGMTVSSNGTLIYSLFISQGSTYLPIEGAIILPFGRSLGFTVQGTEVGVFSLIMTGWFEEAQ